MAPPDNTPLCPTDRNFQNNLDFCPLIPATTIASAKVTLSGTLSAASFFSLAESKVDQAKAFRRISVTPRISEPGAVLQVAELGIKFFPKG